MEAALLFEPESLNYFRESEVPYTQTRTIPSGTYSCWIEGYFGCKLTITGVVSATVVAGTPQTIIIPTGGGSITFTPFKCTHVQFETPDIPTTKIVHPDLHTITAKREGEKLTFTGLQSGGLGTNKGAIFLDLGELKYVSSANTWMAMLGAEGVLTTNGINFFTYSTNGVLRFTIYNNSIAYPTQTILSSPITNGGKSLFTWDASTLRVHVNGVLKVTQNFVIPPLHSGYIQPPIYAKLKANAIIFHPDTISISDANTITTL